MNLIDVVQQIDELDDELTIYAAKPWQPGSEVVIAREPDNGGVPEEAKQKNLAYFLEIFVAKEFLEGWHHKEGSNTDANRTCQRLIEYAVDDA